MGELKMALALIILAMVAVICIFRIIDKIRQRIISRKCMLSRCNYNFENEDYESSNQSDSDSDYELSNQSDSDSSEL